MFAVWKFVSETARMVLQIWLFLRVMRAYADDKPITTAWLKNTLFLIAMAIVMNNPQPQRVLDDERLITRTVPKGTLFQLAGITLVVAEDARLAATHHHWDFLDRHTGPWT